MEFNKRFIFPCKAQTDLVCYSIRKQNWNTLMQEFPDYRPSIRSKFFNFYYQQIFKPLTRQKNKDIDNYDRRKDFEQVLVSNDYNENEIRDVVRMDLQDQNHEYDNFEMVSHLKGSEEKVQELAMVALNISQQTERVHQLAWSLQM